MIKFLGFCKGRPLLGIGLSRANCTNLLDGKPIMVDLRVLRRGVSDDCDLNHANLLIMAGETEDTMRVQLDLAIGVPDSIVTHDD